MSPVHEERYHPAGVLSSRCVKRNLSLLEKTSDRVTAQSTVPKILPDFGGFKKSMSVISIPTQQMTTQLKSVQKRPTVGPGPYRVKSPHKRHPDKYLFCAMSKTTVRRKSMINLGRRWCLLRGGPSVWQGILPHEHAGAASFPWELLFGRHKCLASIVQ